MPIPAETLGRFIENRRTDPKNDYLFRDASAVLFIESPDPLDAGLAAGAIEMVAHTLGIGVLYNGYLRRVVDSCPAARAYFDMSDERGLNVCMLLGYQQKRYYRTAPVASPASSSAKSHMPFPLVEQRADFADSKSVEALHS